MGQQTLKFDAAEAHAGMPEWWKTKAERAVLSVAERGPFTADDVWTSGLEDPPGSRSRRALGAVIQTMARSGLIVGTGKWIVPGASQLKRHAQPLKQWRRA